MKVQVRFIDSNYLNMCKLVYPTLNKFEVLSRNDYPDRFELLDLITDECTPSDHSVLVTEFCIL